MTSALHEYSVKWVKNDKLIVTTQCDVCHAESCPEALRRMEERASNFRGHPGRLSRGGGTCPELTISSSTTSSPLYTQALSRRDCAVQRIRHTHGQEVTHAQLCHSSPFHMRL